MKKQSAIRWEAALPLLIVIIATTLYFRFFFDSHVRIMTESFGSKFWGAEVNLAKFESNFLEPSMKFEGLGITDKENPSTNLISFSNARFSLSWDALLRGKFVISDASLLGLKISAARKSNGFILPTPPPEPSSTPSETSKLKTQMMGFLTAQNNENALGDIAALLGGQSTNSRLEAVAGSLESKALLTSAQKNLEDKKTEWTKRIQALPQEKDLKDIEARAKAIQLDRFENPQQVQSSIEKIQNLKTEVDTKSNEIKTASNDFQKDVAALKKQGTDLELAIKSDIEKLEKHARIPKIDAKSLALAFLGKLAQKKFSHIFELYENSERYLPKKSEEKKQEYQKPMAQKRQRGRDYQFPKAGAYPAFWLKHAGLSISGTEAVQQASLSGQIENVTTSQTLVGSPTTLKLSGSLPESKIEKLNITLEINNLGPSLLTHGAIQVDGMPLQFDLVNSSDLSLKLTDSISSSQTTFKIVGGEVHIDSKMGVRNAKFTVDSKTVEAKEFFASTFGSISEFKLSSNFNVISGKEPEFEFKTDLTDQFNDKLNRMLSQKIEALKSNLRAQIESSLGPDKGKYFSDLSSFNKVQEGLLKAKEAEVNRLNSELEKEKQKAQAKVQNQLMNEGTKAVEDLKKKFGL